MHDTLLILDLDETLVHAAGELLSREPEFRVGDYFVYTRPHVREFLAKVAGSFELGVWTSAGAEYAEQIVAEVFGDLRPQLSFVWCAERCTQRFDRETHERYFVKDLKKVKRLGYDLRRVIVLDDSPEKHERNFGNLVCVAEYIGQPDDDELPLVLPFLEWLREQPDVRVVEKRSWRSHPCKSDQ